MLKDCGGLQGMSYIGSIPSVPLHLNKAAVGLHVAIQASDLVEQADAKSKVHSDQHPLAYLEQHTWRSPAPA